jgi:hypothetical protein
MKSLTIHNLIYDNKNIKNKLSIRPKDDSPMFVIWVLLEREPREELLFPTLC